jgi:DNA-directed RNA polymerase specialized sigma24 family protein
LRLLLAAFDANQDAAAERFRAVHSKLTTYFTYARCLDPEHWADETIDRAAKRLTEGTVAEDIHAFIHGIARFVVQEARREEQRDREIRRNQPPPPEPQDDGLQCLDRCLSSTAPAQRSLIERYYRGSGSKLIVERRKLANELGITIESLRTRALRIRKELENCVRACQEREGDSVISPEFLSLQDEERSK